MDIKQFELKLNSFRDTQEPNELLNTIFDLLSKNPSFEERDVLEIWLMTYSFEDIDRVVRYWESELNNGSTIRQIKITTFLTVIAKKNMNAREVLKGFLKTINLNENPVWKNLKIRIDDLENQ